MVIRMRVCKLKLNLYLRIYEMATLKVPFPSEKMDDLYQKIIRGKYQ